MDKLKEISTNLISSYLKGKSEADLRETINRRISLAEILSSVLPPETIKLIRLANSLYQADGMSPEVILNLIDLERPDIARVIRESQDNLNWFKKQVKDCKRMFGVG